MTAATLLLFCVVITAVSLSEEQEQRTSSELAHVNNSFEFLVHASFDRTAPLFGPEMERKWAGDHWNPTFLYPERAKDIQGAIFTVPRAEGTSTWVNTVYDVSLGRMQYVYFIPDILVTTIDVHLTTVDKSTTRVAVTYARTALKVDANEHVRVLGVQDRENGTQWQQAIQAYLGADR